MADETTTIEQPKVEAFDLGTRKMETSEAPTEKKEDAATPDATTKPDDSTKPAEEKPIEQKPVVEQPKDFNAQLKEKYAIEDEAQLTSILESNKGLQEQLKKAQETPKEPVFASEQDKAAYEFIKQFPPSRLGEGMQTYGNLLNMDVAKADGKLVMKEAFLLSKPDLTREKAEKLFESDYKRRYTLNKDDFKTDEDFKEAQELAEIDKDEKEAVSRRTLTEKQTAIKKQGAEPAKVEVSKAEEPKLPESHQGYFAKVNDVKIDKLTFPDPTNEAIKYNIAISPERLKDAREFANAYIKDTRLYDKDGKIPNFDPQEMIHIGLMILDPKWYINEHVKQVTSLARTITAEQIAGTKPDKESKGGGDGSGIADFGSQFKEMAAKAVQERAQGR